MACSSPIWIRNRRYYNPKNPSTRLFRDDIKSSLSIAPWDISRQRLLVPCGKCPDCVRRLRNDWFVRLEREFARCRSERRQAIFITITIAPQHYAAALIDPTSFIRRWNERIRHKFGTSFKHAFFQEFGTHPESGSEPRLHFHGIIFDFNMPYNQLRAAVRDLGYVWVSSCTIRRIRYVVKYVTKQIAFNPKEIENQYVTLRGVRTPLATILELPVYTRKFVSPHVGDYLGRFRRPSRSVRSWSYLDFAKGVTYNYSIPRYYDRYLSESDNVYRAVLSADRNARLYGDPLLQRLTGQIVRHFCPEADLSYRDPFSWAFKNLNMHDRSLNSQVLTIPAWLDFDILDFWSDEYGLDLIFENT